MDTDGFIQDGIAGFAIGRAEDMGDRFKSMKWDRVFIDVCTQHDFLEAGAILQAVNREQVLPNLKEIFRWVKGAAHPVISIVESHRPTEPMNEFPMHCIDGTPGQQKPPFTLLNPSYMVETDNYLSLPPDLGQKYRQLIFRKRTRDILSNPKADRLLTQLVADEFVIFGVGIERAMKSLALGLLVRNKPVTVISDCCGCWSMADGDLALRQLAAKGVRLITTRELVTPAPAMATVRRRAAARRPLVGHRHDPSAQRADRRARTDLPH